MFGELKEPYIFFNFWANEWYVKVNYWSSFFQIHYSALPDAKQQIFKSLSLYGCALKSFMVRSGPKYFGVSVFDASYFLEMLTLSIENVI